MSKTLIKNNITKFFIISLLLLCSSCAKNIRGHGYIFDDEYEKYLQKDVSKKDFVLKVMGSPTIISNLDYENQAWIYINEEVENFLFFKPKIVKRKVKYFQFNEDETLKNIQQFSLNDQKNYDFYPEFTRVEDKEIGFFRTLFGNIGQVRAQ